MKFRLDFLKVTLLLAATAGVAPGGPPAHADDPPDIRYENKGTDDGWSATVRGDEKPPPVQPGEAEFTLRVYDGGRRYGPPRNLAGRVLALDVTPTIETCPDGDTRVTSLQIGSWRYDVDGECRDDESGLIHCEPGTWTCRTITESPPVTDAEDD